MHGTRRLIGLAGAIAAIAATLSVGTAAAAGPATVGHVYVNNNSSGHNTIAAFDRHADGSLTPIAGSPFNAGGVGRALRTARPAVSSGAPTVATCSPRIRPRTRSPSSGSSRTAGSSSSTSRRRMGRVP